MTRSTDPEPAVLQQPHSSDCRSRGWCYVPGHRGIPATVWRDRRGRNHQHGMHSFLVLVCLDPRCPAQALVAERRVAQIADELLPVNGADHG